VGVTHVRTLMREMGIERLSGLLCMTDLVHAS
jgi:hypothetical protein